ncbi:MAG TPA: hypothetical protein VK815_00215 [Candidatus Acidoferrales bacterium]|nr:hypothetical protein [Candidatus Acidoferrales bacterium]
MKSRSLIFAALLVAALTAGCKKTNPADATPPSGDNNSTITQQLQNAREMATNVWLKTRETTTNVLESVKESVQSAADYTFDKKDAFTAKASSDLDSLDQNIKELGDKAATGADSVKADAQVKLQDLRDKRVVLQQKLDDVKNATAINWNEAKAGFQQSYDDMKTSVKAAWQWLNDKLGISSQ